MKVPMTYKVCNIIAVCIGGLSMAQGQPAAPPSSNPATPHGAWEFHDSLIPNNPKKPLRLWLEVGDTDNLIRRDKYHDWVLANERMANVLAKKGYPYQFVFAKSARHCDRRVKAQTLPLALEYVWRGYRGI